MKKFTVGDEVIGVLLRRRRKYLVGCVCHVYPPFSGWKLYDIFNENNKIRFDISKIHKCTSEKILELELDDYEEI